MVCGWTYASQVLSVSNTTQNWVKTTDVKKGSSVEQRTVVHIVVRHLAKILGVSSPLARPMVCRMTYDP